MADLTQTAERPAAGVSDRVRRRQLFYVGGFDPASPRKYHAIFSAEAPRQAALDGAAIQTGPLEDRGDLSAGWTVDARFGDEAVRTDYEFLRWYDIVRRVWPKDDLGLFVGIWTSFFDYHRSGIMAAARRDAPVVALASSMPVVWSTIFFLIYASVLAGACAAGGAVARTLGLPAWTGELPPLLLVLAVFVVWRWADRFVNVAWLARGMICVVRAARGDYPDLDARCEAFARRLIAADRAEDADEILVVGHSMGSQLVGQAIAKALDADPQFGRRRARVNLLTLGQLIPFYTLLTADPAYRRDLQALAQARRIGWVDIPSPADGGSAAAMHPLEGVMTTPPADRPSRRSPRFHALMSPDNYKSLRRRPLDYHFAYLRAMDVAGDYDFFRLTTGPYFLTPPPVHGAR